MQRLLALIFIFLAPAASACSLAQEGWLQRNWGPAVTAETRRCAEQGFDFNRIGADGDPVFHLMLSVVGDPEAIAIALNAGANPDVVGRRGAAAYVDMLNFAHPDDDERVSIKLDLLGQAGSTFALTDNYDYTALERAVGKGFERSVAVLLRYGADPNQLGTYGRAPLFNTVFGSCKPRIGAQLIEAGARIDVMAPDVVARMFEEAAEACTRARDRAYAAQLMQMAGG